MPHRLRDDPEFLGALKLAAIVVVWLAGVAAVWLFLL